MKRYRLFLISLMLLALCLGIASPVSAQYVNQYQVKFANPVAPDSVVVSAPSWSVATEWLLFTPQFSSANPTLSVLQYQWEASTNGGSTWGSLFTGPAFGVTLISGTVEVRCRSINPTDPYLGGTQGASAWVNSANQTYAAPPSGSVTSVAETPTSFFTVSGSPITTSGTFIWGYATGLTSNENQVLRVDASGNAGLGALTTAMLPSGMFASSQAPASVSAASETWSGSTELIQWYANQSSGPASGAVLYYGWETSPDNSTWSMEVFGGPSYTGAGITSGNQYARARAYCLTLSGTSPTPSSFVASSAQAFAASPYGGGGGSLPTDYISGAQPLFDTTTITEIGSGSAYNPIDSAVDTWTSPLTNTPTLTANELLYVYLSSGGASLTVSATAPATNYQGTASEDGSGRRYLYSIRTDASSHIMPFAVSRGTRVLYEANQFAAPLEAYSTTVSSLQTLNLGTTGTSPLNLVPNTASAVLGYLWIQGAATAKAFIGNSTFAPTTSAGIFTASGLAPAGGGFASSPNFFEIPLVSNSIELNASSSADSDAVGIAGYDDQR